jgi:hypothetical protein
LSKIIRKGKLSVNAQISELEKLLLPLAAKSQVDGLVKIPTGPFFVIPAKAGIQFFQIIIKSLDSGFHRSDDFL